MTTTNTLGDWDFDNQNLYLDPNETDLLINALNSNKPTATTAQTQSTTANRNMTSNPYLDFDTSNSFDWDLKAMGTDSETFTEYPPNSDRKSEGSDDGSHEDSPEYDDGDIGDKRKADSPDGEDGPGKRQETGKKTQKPGRKPLTSEPTTKRKAQNRAAQRAFRERKEKHLKDLEDKVDELQKQSDTANSENTLLKAQVSRLQTELSEYRKQLSTPAVQNSFGGIGNPSRNSWDSANNFNFEFPKFGITNDKPSRSTSSTYGKNPTTPISPARSNSQVVINGSDLKDLFSADILSKAERASVDRTSSHSNYGSRSNSTIQPLSPANTASPASSGFNGFTSSCVTTPESTADIPDARKSSDAGGKLVDRKSFSLTPGAMTTTSTDSGLDFANFDWLANQNGGEFNPALFGDYREPQENIMSGDGWFFNDAFAVPDFGGSPLTQTNSQTMPKKTFMQEIEDTQSGKEPEVVPGEAPQEFLTCNLLWDRVQKSQKVMSGEADMDDLCTQLKSKAKCSGSGAVISQNDVDAILGPIASKDVEPNYLNMFK